MRIRTPKKRKLPPCNPRKKHLQTLSDARAWRDRFRLNPWAKVGSLLVPQPLRLQSLGFSCDCCDTGCECCCFYAGFANGDAPCCLKIVISGIIGGGSCDDLNGTYYLMEFTNGDYQDLCSSPRITARFVGFPANKVTITLAIDGEAHQWRRTFSSEPTCPDDINGTAPFLSTISGSCDASSSIATITVVGRNLCRECPADCCNNEIPPLTITVVINGIVENGCGDCDEYNGTFVCGLQQTGICTWNYGHGQLCTGGGSACCIKSARLRVFLDYQNFVRVKIEYDGTEGPQTCPDDFTLVLFEKTSPIEDITCPYSGDVPLVSAPGGCGCGPSPSATCEIL